MICSSNTYTSHKTCVSKDIIRNRKINFCTVSLCRFGFSYDELNNFISSISNKCDSFGGKSK